MITQQKLKEILDYNKETGLFTWKVNIPPRAKIGKIAGFDNGNGYIKISISGKKYYSHRLAFLWVEGLIPKEIDHINQCRHDNRWDNLRKSDRIKNCANVRGRKGIRFRYGKWYARYRDKHIGVFETKEEAEKAYKDRIKEIAGDHSPFECERVADPKINDIKERKSINKPFLYKGLNLKQWSRKIGIPQPTLWYRINQRKIPIEQVLGV